MDDEDRRTRVIEILQDAAEADTLAQKEYHIRQALQLLTLNEPPDDDS